MRDGRSARGGASGTELTELTEPQAVSVHTHKHTRSHTRAGAPLSRQSRAAEEPHTHSCSPRTREELPAWITFLWDYLREARAARPSQRCGSSLLPSQGTGQDKCSARDTRASGPSRSRLRRRHAAVRRTQSGVSEPESVPESSDTPGFPPPRGWLWILRGQERVCGSYTTAPFSRTGFQTHSRGDESRTLFPAVDDVPAAGHLSGKPPPRGPGPGARGRAPHGSHTVAACSADARRI